MTLENYLRRLRAWLGRGERADRIVDEIRAHLEDATDAERGRGTRRDAEERATRRLGSPHRLAWDFYRRTPAVLLDRMQPFVIVGTALLGLAFADLGALFQGHALLRYGVSTQTLVHLGLSAGLASAVLVVLAALFLRKPRLDRWARGVAPFILGLGVVGGLLATWSGTTTGDWEYYLYLMHGSNFVLGAFTLRCFPSRRSV